MSARFAAPLAAVPLLACCAAAALPGAARDAAVTARSPLGVTATVAACPRVPGGRTVFAPFLVHNTGDEPLTLSDVAPDCGCLAPLIDREAFDPADPPVIAPGAAAVLILRADTAREPAGVSEHEVRLAAVTDSGVTHRQTVRMRYAIGPHELKVDPPGVIVMQGAGASSTQTITVTDRRPDPLVVLDVHSPVDYVSAVPLDPVPLEGGGVALPFEVTVTGARDRDVVVSVEVADPAGSYETVQLPVMCRSLPAAAADRAAAKVRAAVARDVAASYDAGR